ncbi:SafA/ExsA family spore coat assembly protein [Virgibacillus necropolis]|uniref:LysM peptidoglycan-binding domain-containing protein n=1 Tax=Virgibacillus necropolis TaxID=163877 RepID=UPI00384FF907
MKIHIVKKGDTLWEIANNYNVNFEQLKELNSQLSSPDMIMPGMKIKVPSSAKPVKKEGMQVKEKEMVKTPYKDISPKPLPVIKEDEKEKPKAQPMPKPQPPQQKPISKPKVEQKPPMYHMPIMDQDMYHYTTNINFTQMPPQPPQPKKEVKHHEKKHPMPQHMPMAIPMCCYPMHPMHHHMHHPMHHPMHHGQVSPMHMPQQKPVPHKPCGCAGEKPPFQNNVMGMYDEEPEMEMPKKPEYKYDEMKNNHHYGGFNNSYPRMDTNQEQGNPYPAPPGFQPFPTASFRDDEDENNNE